MGGPGGWPERVRMGTVERVTEKVAGERREWSFWRVRMESLGRELFPGTVERVVLGDCGESHGVAWWRE